MNDTISRQGVLRILYTMPPEELKTKLKLIELVKLMPSAQHGRERGKWEPNGYRVNAWDIGGIETWARLYKCSECGFVHTVIEDFGHYKFCPNCGADMRG